MRLAVLLVTPLALFACGGVEAALPDAAAVADPSDASVDPCEQASAHDACLATVGCAWYSPPLCTTDGTPLPIHPDGCYSAALGANPECVTDADCAAGDLCIVFVATEECGPATTCAGNACGGVASSWCRPKSAM